MRLVVVLFIIFLYEASSGRTYHSSQGGHSDLHHSSQESQKYRVLKTFAHSGASVWLIVREAGHMVGQPFQVELRVQCSSSSGSASNENIMNLPVNDSFSVCDLDPESVLINTDQTAMAMKTKSVDMNDYNRQTASGTVDIQPKCSVATTIKTFSLENLCQQ